MLQQPNRLSLHQLVYHVAQHSPHGVESLIRVADVRQTRLIQQDFLNDEDRNGLGEFGTGFHDPQAERDYFRREQEMDDSRVVVLL